VAIELPGSSTGRGADNYSDLLGRRGWEAYQQLAQTDWEHLSANGNLHTPEQRERCVRLTALIESLAQRRGDAATLITIKSRSLEVAGSYLEIARLYKQMGDEKLALDWARRGRERFPAIDASELYEFLAEEYETRAAWQEALPIIFAQFCVRPSLQSYQRIVHAAQKADELENWRERALGMLRQPTGGTSRASDSGALAQSTLVSIRLWENDAEAAWQAAQQGSCNDKLLQEIAKRRAKQYPNDALLIYKHLVALYVGRKNRYSYELAVETLRRIGRLLRGQKRQAEFVPYIEGLCRSHRYQHSLVKMLRQLVARYSRGKVGKNG
jgi:uncharacterized Zn finger protein